MIILANLVVRVKDARVSQFDDLLDAARGRAVQIAFVLAEFDEEAVIDIALHLLPLQKVVIDAICFTRLGRS